MPTRYYLPRADVHMELLSRTETHTQCPYKGIASYFAATVDGRRHDDIAWSYVMPVPECPKVEQLVCFFDEKVETEVDGVVQPRPATKWTTGIPRTRPRVTASGGAHRSLEPLPRRRVWIGVLVGIRGFLVRRCAQALVSLRRCIPIGAGTDCRCSSDRGQ